MQALSAMILAALAIGSMPVRSAAQISAEGRDGLIDHMTGIWKLEGRITGQDAHHQVQVDWVLDHRFLQIHEKTAADAPGTERRYEATWFLGYDPVSERYVVHLLDIFGARFSETLGYGRRQGNVIRVVFEYPDGPFHTTYTWFQETDTWQWLMEQKDKNGKWANFADLKLRRVGGNAGRN